MVTIIRCPLSISSHAGAGSQVPAELPVDAS
jgi:hypothetical protein